MFVTASLFVLAFFQVFVANASHSEYPAKRHVLLINSYHQGFKWTDDVVRAVNDVFATTAHPIELYVEYMDTKRVFNSRYLESFQKTIADKYKSVKLDTVLVSDNNAFSLMLQYRDEIFPGVPVVFSGVNNFHESMIEGRPDFIGVPEIFDAHGTIEAALKTHNGIRRIFVVHDHTPTGKAWAESVRQQTEDLASSVEFTYADAMTVAELKDRLTRLKKDTLVLFTLFFRDSEGAYLNEMESISLVTQASPVPVYGLVDIFVGGGMFGGKLIGGYFQAEAMAKLAVYILNGNAPASIPVIRAPLSHFIYEYPQLKRFNVPEYKLPDGAKIIGKPESFYQRNKQTIEIIIIVFVILSAIIIFLSINVLKRIRAEKELRRNQEDLEHIVTQRTAELSEEIHERKLTEEQLVVANERFTSVLGGLDAIVYVADMKTYEILYINEYTKREFGDITGQICWKALQASMTGPCEFCTNDQLVGAGGEPNEPVLWDFQNTLNDHWFHCRDRAIAWTGNRLVRMEIATDISERKQAEAALEKSKKDLEATVINLDASRNDLEHRKNQLAILARKEATLNKELQQEVRSRIAAEKKSRYMAQHDGLTNLPNRRLFNEMGTLTLAAAKRKKLTPALLFLDIDGFKSVNDSYGHGVGDQLLVLVAERLKDRIRESDIVARVGGDEFVILLVEKCNAKDAQLVAAEIVKAIAEPFDIGGHIAKVGASIGIALYPVHGTTIDQLEQNSDTAMYGVKENGKNGFGLYKPAPQEKIG